MNFTHPYLQQRSVHQNISWGWPSQKRFFCSGLCIEEPRFSSACQTHPILPWGTAPHRGQSFHLNLGTMQYIYYLILKHFRLPYEEKCIDLGPPINRKNSISHEFLSYKNYYLQKNDLLIYQTLFKWLFIYYFDVQKNLNIILWWLMRVKFPWFCLFFWYMET